MKQFDLEKLDKAIIYAERMAEGKAPYSNQYVENEVLSNPNVIRSLYFIKEVLNEVRANGGIVGSRRPKASKSNAAALFPYEVLKHFEYQYDKPVSYVLKQFVELTGDPDTPIITAAGVNSWLSANGFITKAVVNSEGRENWIPTEKGEEIGLAGVRKGEPGREYVRLEYNKDAQEFLARNLKKITDDWLEFRKKKRQQ